MSGLLQAYRFITDSRDLDTNKRLDDLEFRRFLRRYQRACLVRERVKPQVEVDRVD